MSDVYGSALSVVTKLRNLNLQYGDEIPRDIIDEAKFGRLVIVTGASDDLIEFEGAIDDEGAPGIDGGIVYFDDNHIAQNDEELKYNITAIWKPKAEKGNVIASWRYKADFPLHEFKVMEDDYVYCIGAVFCMDNVISTYNKLSDKTEFYDSVLIKEVFGLSSNPVASDVYTYLVTNGATELENIWNAALKSADEDDINVDDSVYMDGDYVLLEYNNGVSIRYSTHPIIKYGTDDVIKVQKV